MSYDQILNFNQINNHLGKSKNWWVSFVAEYMYELHDFDRFLTFKVNIWNRAAVSAQILFCCGICKSIPLCVASQGIFNSC